MKQVKEINRRQFIGFSGAAALGLLSSGSLAGCVGRPSSGEFLFLEAEDVKIQIFRKSGIVVNNAKSGSA